MSARRRFLFLENKKAFALGVFSGVLMGRTSILFNQTYLMRRCWHTEDLLYVLVVLSSILAEGRKLKGCLSPPIGIEPSYLLVS